MSARTSRYLSDLQRNFNEFRKNDQLLDFRIVIGENVYHAHKVILAASSEYFKLVITNQMRESIENEVIVKDIDPCVMEAILDFCYTFQINLTHDNVSEILIAASRFCIDSLLNECVDFIRSRINVSNCLGIIDLSERCNLSTLYQEALDYCVDNFDLIVDESEFLTLDEHLWELFLKNDRLNLWEKNLFEKLVEWTKAHEETRVPIFDRLVKYIRFAVIDTLELVRLNTLEVAKESESCRNVIDMTKNYLLLKDHPNFRRDEWTSLNVNPRDSLKSKQRIFAFGGWTEEEKALSHAEIYDPISDKWDQTTPMNERRCGLGCAVLGNLIYAVGGHDGQKYLASVEQYDTTSGLWSNDVPHMSIARSSVGVVELNGYLYAIGGQAMASATDWVEKYCPNKRKWFSCTSLSQRRLGAAVTVLNGFIYVLGGAEMQHVFETVEKYDPSNDTWTYVASMKAARKHHGCTSFNGKIYAIGGRTNGKVLNSAEVYDPATDSWSEIPSMPTNRHGVSVVELDGHIYVVGGQSIEPYLNIVEYYDPKTGKWDKKADMAHDRLGGGVVVHPTRKYC